MKRRILLVEDNPATIDVMEQELVFLGYEVTVARNGIEAVERASSELPDLVVMDIVLPGMDGLEAASRIRNGSKTQSIPILAATAKAMPGDRRRCLAGGCDDYIAKPFSHRELGDAIKKLLKKESE
ncbi:MAG: response regulator [Candidatus Binatia bacterium]